MESWCRVFHDDPKRAFWVVHGLEPPLRFHEKTNSVENNLNFVQVFVVVVEGGECSKSDHRKYRCPFRQSNFVISELLILHVSLF